MNPLLRDGIDDYIEEHLPPRPDVIHEMEALAKERGFPMVGPQVGQFLKMLTATTGARRVFELGSGFGYSAIWFALGLPNDGEITLTDFKPEYLDEADQFLTRLWLQGKARYLAGDALEHFRAAKEPFDIVFSDIDKEQYPEVVDLAHDKLVPGGWFITDNALWDGKVLDTASADAATKGVLEFNKRVRDHEGFETVILPVRDGLMMARKIDPEEKLWVPS